jgi:hypothetical protein
VTRVNDWLNNPESLLEDLRKLYSESEKLIGLGCRLYQLSADGMPGDADEPNALLDWRRTASSYVLLTQSLSVDLALLSRGENRHYTNEQVVKDLVASLRKWMANPHDTQLKEQLWQALFELDREIVILREFTKQILTTPPNDKPGKAKGTKTGIVRDDDIKRVADFVTQYRLRHGEDPDQKTAAKETRLGSSKISKIFGELRKDGTLKRPGRTRRSS